MKPVFSTENIKTTEFKDRWVKFAFGHQGLQESENLDLGIVKFKPGKEPLEHSHDVEEALYILEGKGRIQIGDHWFKLEKGQFAYIPKGAPHRIESDEKNNLEILFIFGGKTSISY